MSISSEKLKSIVEQLEALEKHKEALMDDVRDLFAEAKNDGFDIKTLKQVLRVRKMKPEDISQQEELLHLYLDALHKSD